MQKKVEFYFESDDANLCSRASERNQNPGGIQGRAPIMIGDEGVAYRSKSMIFTTHWNLDVT